MSKPIYDPDVAYAGVNMLFCKYFAFHDLEYEQLAGSPESVLVKMKEQNKRTEKAYLADCKSRKAAPA